MNWVSADSNTRGLADPQARKLSHGLVGQSAAPRDDADPAGLVDMAGHDADLATRAGRDDAGQLGPIRFTGLSRMYRTTGTVSSTGMPSVMQAITGIPASTDSTMASAANAGGTKMSETLARVSATACSTVLYTGTESPNMVPPRPGVTPATRLVPYSRHRSAWKLPSRPVMPCTNSRVFLSTRMLKVSSASLPTAPGVESPVPEGGSKPAARLLSGSPPRLR